MGISRHVPLFIEGQSFRFCCRLEILWTPADCVPVHFAFGSFTTGWNHQRVQLRPLCSNRYRNGEPLKLTRRANSCYNPALPAR